MKTVILAGGLGTRLSEETHLKPKPMVEVGGYPILWHIMKLYSFYGINEFIVCLGYKGYVIKEYFANYFLHMSNVTFDMCDNAMHVHQNFCEPWKVTLVDTGTQSMTGGRLRRVREYLDDEPFCFTYGDGVSNLDIAASVAFHNNHGCLATMTAVQPPGRFGALDIDDASSEIRSFTEKPRGDNNWINGGFFVLDPKVVDYIDGDDTIWEKAPLEGLARDRQLRAFRHAGFWQAMDTLRDKNRLEQLWQSGEAPWKLWK